MSNDNLKKPFSYKDVQVLEKKSVTNSFIINDSQRNFFSFSPLVGSFVDTLIEENYPKTAELEAVHDKSLAEHQPLKNNNSHRDFHNQFIEKFSSQKRSDISDEEFLTFMFLPHLGINETKQTVELISIHWGNLSNLLRAGIDEIKRKSVLSEKAIFLIEFMFFIPEFVLKRRILNKPVLNSWTELTNYVRLKIGHLAHEEFHVWFLNHACHLIAEECLSKGTVNQAVIYPRNIVKMALEKGASSIILLHNHPSGDTLPSGADIQVTQKVIKALASVDIQLLDHLVVGDQQITSFRNLGLI